MSKRNNKYERRPRDLYETPEKPVEKLVPYLPTFNFTFLEPCAASGKLARNVERLSGVGRCVGLWDIYPLNETVSKVDALLTDESNFPQCDFIITNPPWDRKVLHPMIQRFMHIRPTWLLFDSDWFFTKQAEPFKPYLHRMVGAGRVRFMEGTPEDKGSSPMDNCSWYYFDGTKRTNGTLAY